MCSLRRSSHVRRQRRFFLPSHLSLSCWPCSLALSFGEISKSSSPDSVAQASGIGVRILGVYLGKSRYYLLACEDVSKEKYEGAR